MTKENVAEKITKRGGAREGAGRKKTLPDGSKPTSFILTDEEKINVKKFIANMRAETSEKPKVNTEVVNVLFKTGIKSLEPIALALIEAHGGKPYSKVEKMMKDVAIIAFKDAVSEYETKNAVKL